MAQRDNLKELIARPDATVEEGALCIAADAYPNLDRAHYLAKIDALAALANVRLEDARSPLVIARITGEFLFNEHGFKGNDTTYYDERNSYLNDVLDRKTGIPLTLAMVIVAILRRCGRNAAGILFPGHFLVRIGEEPGCFIDPFVGARVLGQLDLSILVRRALGPNARVEPSHLAVADTRSMLIRMLYNLRGIFQSRGDHARVMLTCDRLLELDAGPMVRRDRGLSALARGAYEAAKSDLEAYLEERPDAGDRSTVEKALREIPHERKLN